MSERALNSSSSRLSPAVDVSAPSPAGDAADKDRGSKAGNAASMSSVTAAEATNVTAQQPRKLSIGSASQAVTVHAAVAMPGARAGMSSGSHCAAAVYAETRAAFSSAAAELLEYVSRSLALVSLPILAPPL